MNVNSLKGKSKNTGCCLSFSGLEGEGAWQQRQCAQLWEEENDVVGVLPIQKGLRTKTDGLRSCLHGKLLCSKTGCVYSTAACHAVMSFVNAATAQ